MSEKDRKAADRLVDQNYWARLAQGAPTPQQQSEQPSG